MTRSRRTVAVLSTLAVLASLAGGGCFSERIAANGGGVTGDCTIPVGPIVGTTTAVVAIEGFAFEPQTLRVRPGTTVVWVNCEDEGTEAHTSTADEGAWDSSFLSPGATYSFTFATAGEFDYHCIPHPFMQGAVIVEE
jgi:plastocyanin